MKQTSTINRNIISLLLKAIVFLFAVSGTIMTVLATSETFMGGPAVLMFFTIQSNLALALVSLIGAIWLLSKKNIPGWWYIIKYVATVSITLTGAVFTFVLAPTMGPAAWSPINVFTHVIVPVASVADFFVIGVNASIAKRNVFFVIIPPLLYAIYAGIGYVNKWEFAPGIHYPYFFLNWGSPAGAFGFSKELPFIGCAWWILLLLILLILVGYLYLVILDKIKKHRKK